MKRSILTARWVVATLVLGSAIGSWTTPSAEGQVCLWSNSVAYPINVLDQASVTQGGFLYCFAGVSENGVIADSFRFDGTTWTAIAPVPAAVEFPAAVSDGTFCTSWVGRPIRVWPKRRCTGMTPFPIPTRRWLRFRWVPGIRLQSTWTAKFTSFADPRMPVRLVLLRFMISAQLVELGRVIPACSKFCWRIC